MRKDAKNVAVKGSMEPLLDDSASTSLTEEKARTRISEITILCEVVGARNLVISDERDAAEIESDSLRPFCILKFYDRIIHRTKCATENGSNPIWTLSTRSLCLIKARPQDVSQGVVNISVHCKRDQGISARFLNAACPFLGQVDIDFATLLGKCDGTRFELPLQDELGEESSDLGKIALRFRVATPSDMQMMKLLSPNPRVSRRTAEKGFVKLMLDPDTAGVGSFVGSAFGRSKPRQQAKLVTETAETEVARSSFVNALNNVFSPKTVIDTDENIQKVKVKPYPDPKRIEDTRFMSSQEIRVETRRPSQNWIEAGSGKLGKVYVEILACHDLPNMDVGEAMGNVTDSFVTMVYEDAVAMTEVIDDELSPHWLPWTQRAFSFGMMHPASILYLGVFDYDLGIGAHEPIGRVAVNLCNLQRNTIYTLKYKLYPSSNVTDRTSNGSITIRLRIECPDEKEALMVALRPRPKIFVNVKKDKSFKVIRYTCFGEFDNEEKFDLTVARSYINEIFENKSALQYTIADTVGSLMFWRGQVQVFSIWMPLHSLLFFVMATNLIERPHLIVPFSLLSVAWAMLANLGIRRQHPSPWNRCPSFYSYLKLLRTGESETPITSIKEYEGNKAATVYEAAWQRRLEEDRMVAEKRAELQQEIATTGDDNISTKVAPGGIPLDLMNRLARYQGYVGRVCRFFRFIRIIVTWEESVVSFWITAVFLGAGIVTLVLPWDIILTWTSRIFIWGFFGPHMKLVDLVLRANKSSEKTLQGLMKKFNVQRKLARIRREHALKEKDVKEIAFGKYSIQVPSFNLARHYDRPLPDSSARVCRLPAKKNVNSVAAAGGRAAALSQSRRLSLVELSDDTPWLPGQQLHGTMIPRAEKAAVAFAEELRLEEERLAAFQQCAKELADEGYSQPHASAVSSTTPSLDVSSSMGYEVFPQADDDDNTSMGLFESKSDVTNHSRVTRMSIVLSNDEMDEAFNDAVTLGPIVEDDDGTIETEYHQPREAPSETEPDFETGGEEGFEVVGLGRYSTIDAENEELERELLQTKSAESIVPHDDSRLSMTFKKSDKIEVAFYRPIQGRREGGGEEHHTSVPEEISAVPGEIAIVPE